MKIKYLISSLFVVALLAGCTSPQQEGGNDPAVATQDKETIENTENALENDMSEGAEKYGVKVDGEVGDTPNITLTEGTTPPSELIIIDLVEGDGEEVTAGSEVEVNYEGVSWLNDGRKFDSSFDRGESISFPLGGVISGWSEGLVGQKVGGRRLLIIPPEMGYGANSPTPDIADNDTLVFVVDMLNVRK